MKLVEKVPSQTAGRSCYLCHTESASLAPFVQTGAVIDYEGHLVICYRCAKSMAKLIGWIAPETHEGVKDTNQRVLAENRALVAQVQAAEAVRDAVAAFNLAGDPA